MWKLYLERILTVLVDFELDDKCINKTMLRLFGSGWHPNQMKLTKDATNIIDFLATERTPEWALN